MASHGQDTHFLLKPLCCLAVMQIPSLVPRPAPSFPSLAVRLSGRGPGTFSHVSDVTGRKAVERL